MADTNVDAVIAEAVAEAVGSAVKSAPVADAVTAEATASSTSGLLAVAAETATGSGAAVEGAGEVQAAAETATGAASAPDVPVRYVAAQEATAAAAVQEVQRRALAELVVAVASTPDAVSLPVCVRTVAATARFRQVGIEFVHDGVPVTEFAPSYPMTTLATKPWRSAMEAPLVRRHQQGFSATATMSVPTLPAAMVEGTVVFTATFPGVLRAGWAAEIRAYRIYVPASWTSLSPVPWKVVWVGEALTAHMTPGTSVASWDATDVALCGYFEATESQFNVLIAGQTGVTAGLAESFRYYIATPCPSVATTLSAVAIATGSFTLPAPNHTNGQYRVQVTGVWR